MQFRVIKVPSPDWGRLGWGVSRKDFILFRHSEQRSRAERDSESPSLGLDFFSFPDLGKAGMGSVPQGICFVVTPVGFSVGRCVSDSEPSP